MKKMKAQTFQFGPYLTITAVPDARADMAGNLDTVTFVGEGADRAGETLSPENLAGTATAYVAKATDYIYNTGDTYYLFDSGLGLPDARPEQLRKGLDAAGFASDETPFQVYLCAFRRECFDTLLKDGKALLAKAKFNPGSDDIIFMDDEQGTNELMDRFRALGDNMGTGFTPRPQQVEKLMADRAWGFTLGSAAFYLDAGGTRLAFLGELLRYAPLQLANPGVSEKGDFNPEQHGESRKAVFQRILDNGWLVAGAHLPFPGIGRLEKSGEGFAFVPMSGKEVEDVVAAAAAEAAERGKKADAEAAKIPELKKVTLTVVNNTSGDIAIANDPNWDDQVVTIGGKTVKGSHPLAKGKQCKVSTKWKGKADPLMMGLIIGDGKGTFEFAVGYRDGGLRMADAEDQEVFVSGEPGVQYREAGRTADTLMLVFTDK